MDFTPTQEFSSLILFVDSSKFRNIVKAKNISSIYSRYYAEACNKWRANLRDLASGQDSSEETSQRWRAAGDTAFDLTDLRIELQTSLIVSSERVRQQAGTNIFYFSIELFSNNQIFDYLKI